MNREETLQAFNKLLDVMDELREQCPWDKKQTWASIRPLTIEETYELNDALLANDSEEVKKELGDLLLHIVFYSRIASETQTFDMGEVCKQLTDKLIRRHPHIYGDVQADDAQTVLQNWEQIKLQEKGNKKNGVLDGVPKGLTGIIKAYRMQEKASQVGFDWLTPEEAYHKIEEEWNELKEAQTAEHKEEEFGDYLFALINWARLSKIHPDDALERTNRKFYVRFRKMEDLAEAQGKSIAELNFDEQEALYQEAKRLLKHE